MIGNRFFAVGCDENEFLDARRTRFFNGVLDHRLIDHRNHFFWDHFRGGEKARTQTGDRQYCFANSLRHTTSLKTHSASGFVPWVWQSRNGLRCVLFL